MTFLGWWPVLDLQSRVWPAKLPMSVLGHSRIRLKCIEAQYCLNYVLFFPQLFSLDLYSISECLALSNAGSSSKVEEHLYGIICVNCKDTLVRLPRLAWRASVLNQTCTVQKCSFCVIPSQGILCKGQRRFPVQRSHCRQWWWWCSPVCSSSKAAAQVLSQSSGTDPLCPSWRLEI